MEVYDRNDDFGNSKENMQTDYCMTIPDITNYSDLNGEKKVCIIEREEMDKYLRLFGKSLNKKILYLYKEKYLCTSEWLLQKNLILLEVHAGRK